MKLLLTGGTGSVGVEFLRQALADRTYDEIGVVVRADTNTALGARRQTLLRDVGIGADSQAAATLRLLRGELTTERLSLADADAAWVAAEATHIMHAAALTDFNADLRLARQVNVDGLRHTLTLARGAGRLQAVAHVSTLYVAGRRTGMVREDDLDHDAGFVNPYEQSKYEAEQYIRTQCVDLPIATYRLSLLMGRASDGYVHRTLEAHKMFELFLSGRATRIPGAPANTLDMLPTDYAAQVLHTLFARHFVAGETVQISAGHRAATGADLVESCRRVLGNPEWDVEWIDECEWAQLRAADGGDQLSPAAFWMFDVVADYLFLSKHFVRNRVDARLGAAATAPAALDYLPRIVEARMACNWGRA